MTEESAALDVVLARLRERIEQRRADGTYPDDLEEQLATHYEHIVAARSSLRLDAAGRLEERIEDVRKAAHFEPRPAPIESKLPGGRVAHRALNPFVVRHADELRRQMGEYASTVTRALDELREFEYEVGAALRRMHDLVRDNTHLFSTLHAVEHRVAELTEHQEPTWFRPWFTNEAFEATFRGTRDEILDRYRGLVAHLDGCGTVLDLGCGRGEILELLRERAIHARGVELDAQLVHDARSRGLDVEHANGMTALAEVDDGSLGGLVMIQVIEHLSPQQIADLVPIAARKLRPGGRVVIETVNPLSLYVFGHALYLDPTHLRLVHPYYLQFLFREAGFMPVVVEWRTPPPDDERLEELPAGEPLAKRLNPVIRRLNEVVFGPQDYALIATR